MPVKASVTGQKVEMGCGNIAQVRKRKSSGRTDER
jgi:hypothetical protein